VNSLLRSLGCTSLFCLLALIPVVNADPGKRDCMVIATPIDFGRYDAQRGGLAAGTVDVKCPGQRFQVLLSLDGYPVDPWDRMLRSAEGKPARFNLYVDPGHQAVWGEPQRGASALQGMDSIRFTVYAWMPPGQQLEAGRYYEAFTVTVEAVPMSLTPREMRIQ